jgi:hypothetical protein
MGVTVLNCTKMDLKRRSAVKRPEAHNLMKIYELYSFRLLNGKQEESLKESLCAQAVLDTAHSRNFKSLINQI